MIRRFSLLFAVASVSLTVAQNPPVPLADAPPVLRKALQNAPKLRYVGTVIREFRRNGVTDRHEELITRDGPFTRIEFPEGSSRSGQIIVESATDRRQFFPDTNEIHILPVRRDEAFDRLGRMIANKKMSISTAPGAVIAGVHTDQVVVADRSGNVLQRMYIDPDSGVILKRELFDAVGTPFGSFEFKTIDLSPHINRRMFRIVRFGAKVLTPTDLLERLAKEKDFSPITLPTSTGYRLEGSFVRPIEGKNVLFETYTSSTGRTLTLCQLKTPVRPEKMRDFSRREDLKSTTWQSGGLTFVLVGNIEESELARIARTISGTP